MKLKDKLKKVLTEDELEAVMDAMENTLNDLDDCGFDDDMDILESAWNKMFDQPPI